MSETALDLEAMLERFQERAKAVRTRTLPPVGGEERQRFIDQAQHDFQDFAIIGHANEQCAALGIQESGNSLEC